MGLFDIYSDVMQKVGSAMQAVDPFGPIGMAGETVTSLLSTADLVSDHGVDALWTLASDAGEAASVVEFFLPKSKQTPIISGGLKVVQGLQAACGGTNPPEKGEAYGQSAQQFNAVADGLQAAFPDERWVGSASDAYYAANASQQKRARTIPDVDLDVLMAVEAEAGTVSNTRRILNNAAMMMGNAIAPAIAAKSIPRFGKIISTEIELAVVGVSLPTCLWYMDELAETSARTTATLEKAAALYRAIANECYPTWI
ncbi:EspA/EspE family type VII secretion system effector [Mycobacterium hubeiense]|uniref:EspA/EspE family type VII secretion system effector n=1 Tax=Mycobacterium hubeiense TaxID=1867256 RepID=UPI000C7ED512|nr:EspA/EspE family type VII secretion system effector [Mycobacterium sp. QGD 101]